MDISRKVMKAPVGWVKRSGEPNNKKISTSAKVGLQFPVGRIGRYLKKGKYAKRVGRSAAISLAAALEYLVAEVTHLLQSPFNLSYKN